jgi:signal transduction histidine kinase
VLEAAQILTTVLLAVVALAAVRVHRRQRTAASRWLAVAFGGLGAAVVLGRFAPEPGGGGAERALELVIVAGILVFPWALFRFAGTFEPFARTAELAAAGVGLLLLAGVALTPDDGPGSAASVAIALLASGWWTALSAAVVVRFLRSSRGQPTVARRRLRLMAAAAAVLCVALVGVAAVPGADEPARVGIQVLAMVSAVLFLIGFAPPAAIRRAWRAAEEDALRDAERSLLAATSTEDVARAITPTLARVFGGEAVLEDAADPGAPPAGGGPGPPPGGVALADGALVLGLSAGRLVVRATPFTPFFGSEEVGMLRGLGTALDLAVSRVRLQEDERRARQQVEAANTELEALLYGISHDLRSPLVALTGYVELLAEGASTAEDRSFVLERIAANTSYMDALIRDLLELSRVGRVDERHEDVDLGPVVDEVAAELRLRHPLARIEVGDLPTVAMPAVRARQLVANLVANALRHGGRADITVRVRALAVPDGVVLSIADDGIGIPVEQRHRVFGIFERLQGRDDGGGTGIGLAMCRKIVEQLGGEMWIADAETGTDVRCRIPAEVVIVPPRRMELRP